MSLQISDNLDYRGKQPDFARQQFATLSAMRAYPEASIPEGYVAYCLETGRRYQWKSSNNITMGLGRWQLVSDQLLSQTTGDSTEVAMSQAAVTKELNKRPIANAVGIFTGATPPQVVNVKGSSTTDAASQALVTQIDSEANVHADAVGQEFETVEENLLNTALRKNAQTLTEAEKTQVRQNIGVPSTAELDNVKTALNALGFKFLGIADPDFEPIVIGENTDAYYIASKPGTYVKFASEEDTADYVVGNEAALLIWRSEVGAWKVVTYGAAMYDFVKNMPKQIEDLETDMTDAKAKLAMQAAATNDIVMFKHSSNDTDSLFEVDALNRSITCNGVCIVDKHGNAYNAPKSTFAEAFIGNATLDTPHILVYEVATNKLQLALADSSALPAEFDDAHNRLHIYCAVVQMTDKAFVCSASFDCIKVNGMLVYGTPYNAVTKSLQEYPVIGMTTAAVDASVRFVSGAINNMLAFVVNSTGMADTDELEVIMAETDDANAEWTVVDKVVGNGRHLVQVPDTKYKFFAIRTTKAYAELGVGISNASYYYNAMAKEARIAQLEQQVATLQAKVAEQATGIESINNTIVSMRQTIENLTGRIQVLEDGTATPPEAEG